MNTAFLFLFFYRWYGCAQGPLIEKVGGRSHASKSRDKAIVPRMRSGHRRPNIRGLPRHPGLECKQIWSTHHLVQGSYLGAPTGKPKLGHLHKGHLGRARRCYYKWNWLWPLLGLTPGPLPGPSNPPTWILLLLNLRFSCIIYPFTVIYYNYVWNCLHDIGNLHLGHDRVRTAYK